MLKKYESHQPGNGGRPINEETTKIRVGLVDDHEVVREGLKSVINHQPDMSVVAEAGTCAEALRTLPGRIDVAVLDIRLPDGTGMSVCQALKSSHPDIRVIMLTSFGDDEVLFESLKAGAAGFLLKESQSRVVTDAIRTVARGGSLLDPGVAQRVLKRLQQATPEVGPMDILSPQERHIVELIAAGKTNKEIGDTLFLSEKTIKHYVSNILAKLGVTRRSEAAAWLARNENK